MNAADTLVVLDTNVLLRPRLSDVIMDLRAEALFSAHWTENIDAEFLRNMQKLYNKTEAAANGRLRAMKRRCPEWEVFMTSADFAAVPSDVDMKDRHVAAAALALRHSAAEEEEDGVGDDYDILLVTDNVKDMAKRPMAALGVKVMRAGAFLNACYRADSKACERAVQQAVSDLKAPPYTAAELLYALRGQGATTLVSGLAKTWNVVPTKRVTPRT